MNNTRISDDFFRVLLKEAFSEAIIEEVEKSLDGVDLSNPLYTPSKSLEKRIQRIIFWQRLTENGAKIAKSVGKVAVILAVVIAVASITVLSVEAFRNRFFNIIIEWEDDHVSIDFSDISKINDIGESNISTQPFIPLYIPDGFSCVYENNNYNTFRQDYLNSEGALISFQRYLLDNQDVGLKINAGGYADYNPIVINNHETHVFASASEDKMHIIIWEVEEYAYQINGHNTISIDELILMVQSVKY